MLIALKFGRGEITKNHIGSADSVVVISMALFMAFPVIAQVAPVLPAGITADSQNLIGMAAKEAKAVIQEYVDGLSAQSVTLSVDRQDMATTAEEPDFYRINTDAIDKTADRYAGNDLVKQYMIEKDPVTTPVGAELGIEVDSAKVKALVDIQYQGITAEPQNVSITKESGQFVITDSVPGHVVDVTGTGIALNEALEASLEEPIEVTTQVTEEQPTTTNEALATIQGMLGTYTANLSNSGATRSANLAAGAAKTSGCVLMSGDILSGHKCLQSFVTANEYKTMAACRSGQVMNNVGGGVCQLATILYNVSLEAEVGIIQRQNHSMTVTYMKPLRDTITAGTYKDIKIQNNYNAPIYMEGYTPGRELTFTIYDKEIRPANHKMEYASGTPGSTSPNGPQLIVDNTLAPGARVEIRSFHTGLRSRSWEAATVGSVKQKRTLLDKDICNASRAIYRIGSDLSVTLPVVPDVTVPVDIAPAETAPVETAFATDVEVDPGVMQPVPKAASTPETNLAPAEGGPTVISVEGP